MTYFQVRRVTLKHYRSIADTQVDLPRLAFLVGPNGSGKSNFLDALRLVSDSLRTPLDHALRERGGVQEVRRRSTGHPTHFSFTLDFLYGSSAGSYSFTLGARRGAACEVQSEQCRVLVGDVHHFSVANGPLLSTSEAVAPPVARDRLYLVAAAGLPVFRAAYDGLSSMGFYNLLPDRIGETAAPAPPGADRGLSRRRGVGRARVRVLVSGQHPVAEDAPGHPRRGAGTRGSRDSARCERRTLVATVRAEVQRDAAPAGVLAADGPRPGVSLPEFRTLRTEVERPTHE